MLIKSKFQTAIQPSLNKTGNKKKKKKRVELLKRPVQFLQICFRQTKQGSQVQLKISFVLH